MVTQGELLAVLLDLNLLSSGAAQDATADVVLQQLLIFLKAHQLVSEQNHQCVMAILPNSSPVLYMPSSSSNCADSKSAAGLSAIVLQRVQEVVAAQQQSPPQADSLGPDQPAQEIALSAALSRALCYINRHTAQYGFSTRHTAKPRILSIVAVADTPSQYIPVMNCIFAAQHANVVLDALVIGSTDLAFLQQAAHITGGVYMRPEQSIGLLQYMLGAFSADTATRDLLSVSSKTQAVDYRASCFCHKNVIDSGWICSVCLSIFCKANMKLAECPTCGSVFKQKSAAVARAAGSGRGRTPAAAAGGGGVMGQLLQWPAAGNSSNCWPPTACRLVSSILH